MNELTSIEWMRRTHARMPLTPQEQAVKELLTEKHLAFETHHVFGLSDRVRMSVDFLIFSGSGIVLECTYSGRRRGSAISEIRRRCAFIDYRFGLLKGAFPKLSCAALIEAPRENKPALLVGGKAILRNAEIVESSVEALGIAIDKWLRCSQQASDPGGEK